MPKRVLNRSSVARLRVEGLQYRQPRYGKLKSSDRCKAEHKPGYYMERCIRPLAHEGKHVDKNAKEF